MTEHARYRFACPFCPYRVDGPVIYVSALAERIIAHYRIHHAEHLNRAQARELIQETNP